ISEVVELLSRVRNSDSNQDLVFPGTDGQGFLSPTVVLRRHLYPAMTSAEIPRVGPTQEKRTFHSFRHTFAKRPLESGAQLTWLSRHLGHSWLKVTTDIHGHWEARRTETPGGQDGGCLPSLKISRTEPDLEDR